MRKVGTFLYPYKYVIGGIFILIFLQSLAQLYLPTLMGNIVDYGVVIGDIPYIWKVGFFMLGVAAIGVVVSVLVSYFSAKVALGMGRDLREKIFTHVSHFSLQDFDQVGTASLITRSTNDVTQIQQATVIILRMFLMAPFMLIGGLIMALSKDAKLSLVILVAIPIIVLFIAIIMKKAYPLFKSVQIKLDQLNLVFRENLTGIRVIRSFIKEKEEQERLKDANLDLMDVSVKVNQLMAFTIPFMMLLMNITIVFIIWFGGIRIEVGTMQIGDLMAYIQYVMLIMFAVMMASMLFVIIPRAGVSAQRIKEVLEIEQATFEDIVDEERAVVTDSVKSLLQFDDVTFYYPGAEEPALKNISFHVERGKTTAIIGGTGSGKTTLINLIPRFFDITHGDIRLDGVSLSMLPTEKIREKIGLVPQKALLFSGTVEENVRFGHEAATEEEIKHAICIAQGQDFVEKMPDQYDTYIEQGGANLSGGQKQRLSIARALVRKPELYIFDDSFSALDYKTDAKLRSALVAETKDAGVIIVAQRVSTVRNADQVIVLDEGEMVGIGTHDDLLKTNDVYKEIVRSQYGEGDIR